MAARWAGHGTRVFRQVEITAIAESLEHLVISPLNSSQSVSTVSHTTVRLETVPSEKGEQGKADHKTHPRQQPQALSPPSRNPRAQELVRRALPTTGILTPSDTYLAIARSLSRVSSPASRKLIVLDLNGNLVFRPKARNKSRLRAVHPRPFTRAFIEYLFHPGNKDCFDVMIWSSAQPHSVDSMVHEAFGDRKKDLTAIWARDKFGLTKRDYNAKVQTNKDLERIWITRGPLSHHSACTTLLLDDSALKAALQPHNHIPVKEYNHELWAQGVAGQQGSHRKLEDVSGIDDTLIAVVGVLEAAKSQSNVAGWIHSKGLLRPGVGMWVSKEEEGTGADIGTSDPKAVEAMVYHGSAVWFEQPRVYQGWLEQGKKTLAGLGIGLLTGIATP